jgi:predicted small secreted protein
MTHRNGLIRSGLLALAAMACTLTTTACNTVKGVGEDITSVGRAGERAINK